MDSYHINQEIQEYEQKIINDKNEIEKLINEKSNLDCFYKKYNNLEIMHSEKKSKILSRVAKMEYVEGKSKFAKAFGSGMRGLVNGNLVYKVESGNCRLKESIQARIHEINQNLEQLNNYIINSECKINELKNDTIKIIRLR